MQTLAEAPPLPADHGSKKWILRLVPAAAAAGVLMALVLGQGDKVGQSLIPDTQDRGKAAVEKMTRDPHTLRNWYRDKLGIAVVPPRFSDGRTALVGGRIGQVNAKEAAHLIYSRGNQEFSVMVFSPDKVPFRGMASRRVGNKTVYFSYGKDRSVASFHHRGVGYTITGPLPRHELDALVRDVLHQPTGSSEPFPVDAVPVKAP